MLQQEDQHAYIGANGINSCEFSHENWVIINLYYYPRTIGWKNLFPNPGPNSTLVIPDNPVLTWNQRHNRLIRLGEEGVVIPPKWCWNDLWTRLMELSRINPSLRNFDHTRYLPSDHVRGVPLPLRPQYHNRSSKSCIVCPYLCLRYNYNNPSNRWRDFSIVVIPDHPEQTMSNQHLVYKCPVCHFGYVQYTLICFTIKTMKV